MHIFPFAPKKGVLASLLSAAVLAGCGGGTPATLPADGTGPVSSGAPVQSQAIQAAESPAALRSAPAATAATIAGSSSELQSAAAASAPTHVLTAEYLDGSGGYYGSPSTMGKYASWAIGGSPSTDHAAGMKTYAYTNPNRTYRSDNDYRLHDLLDVYPGAMAKSCSGATITTEGGNGILTDVRTRDAIGHATDLVNHVNASGTDAVFMDDSDNVEYTDNGLPCNYNAAAWLAGQKAMYAAQTVPIIFNGLSLLEYNVNSVPLADVSNVVGGMWEGCYGFHSEWGYPGDGTDGLREDWAIIENTELAFAAKGKTFWCFNSETNSGASNIAYRTYAYASFLLTYDQRTSLYETKMSTGSGLRIYPETGIVVTQPVVAAPASVTSLRLSSGAYGREYRACFYRAASIGACAVIVNPDTSTHANPYTASYRHSIALSGAGVLDGGSVSTGGGAAPGNLNGHAAAIMLR